MNNRDVANLTDKYVAQTYARYPVALVRGKGTRVWDADGKEYLDLLAGIAVNSLGHCHPAVVRAIQQQARKLLHVSNLYHIQPQSELARELCRNSFADRVFFCNSGAEANEAAIKLARRYGGEHLGGRYEILSAQNSFHGRTLATLTATGQEKVRAGYDPLPAGFRQIPFNDLRAAEEAIDPEKTAGILVEPIQAEGGVVVADEYYLHGLRELCDRRGLLLIFDEVQTGMGRTGKLFGYEHFGVTPDIMTMAKGLTNAAQPMGAVAISAGIHDTIMEAAQEGAIEFFHGYTYSGHPGPCAAGLATMDIYEREGLFERARALSPYFLDAVFGLQDLPVVTDIRGYGMFAAIDLAPSGMPGRRGHAFPVALQEGRGNEPAAVHQRCRRHQRLQRRDRQAMAEGDRDRVQLAPVLRNDGMRAFRKLGAEAIELAELLQERLVPFDTDFERDLGGADVRRMNKHFRDRQHTPLGVEVVDGESSIHQGARGVEPVGSLVRRASLEDVFLRLTGRTLID